MLLVCSDTWQCSDNTRHSSEHLGTAAEFAARTAAEPVTGTAAETCSCDFTAESGRVPAPETAVETSAEDVMETAAEAVTAAVAEAVVLGALQLRLLIRLV